MIKIYWSKKQKDLVVKYDEGEKVTGRYLLMQVLTDEVLKELEDRNMDLSTLKFSIKQKET